MLVPCVGDRHSVTPLPVVRCCELGATAFDSRVINARPSCPIFSASGYRVCFSSSGSLRWRPVSQCLLSVFPLFLGDALS